MALMTRESFTGAASLRTREIPVTDGEVRILEWDGIAGDQYSELLRSTASDNGSVQYVDDEWRCKVMALSLCGEDNARMFEMDDWQIISASLSYADKVKVYNAIIRQNGIIDEEADDPN